MSELVNIRDMKDADKAFIMATWLKGLFYGDSWFSQIPKNIFMNNYKHIAEGMLSNPKIKVKVACLKDDPDVIIGYSVISSDGRAVIWCFVKTAFRQLGVAKALVPESAVYATLLTTLGKSLLSKRNLQFNPFY